VRHDTAQWLKPMLIALQERGDLTPKDYKATMRRATMPADEADSAQVAWAASHMPTSAQTMVTDWIRYAQLLREELGWNWYPGEPQ
jgi:hypothetical protein